MVQKWSSLEINTAIAGCNLCRTCKMVGQQQIYYLAGVKRTTASWRFGCSQVLVRLLWPFQIAVPINNGLPERTILTPKFPCHTGIHQWGDCWQIARLKRLISIERLENIFYSRWQVKNEVEAPPTSFHLSRANAGEWFASSPLCSRGKRWEELPLFTCHWLWVVLVLVPSPSSPGLLVEEDCNGIVSQKTELVGRCFNPHFGGPTTLRRKDVLVRNWWPARGKVVSSYPEQFDERIRVFRK